ncbi:ATP-binding protein [Methylocucumis oryzae]|uniref:ATP-binding protein n=1 Tax=Methylocucumis oryzae TaxID=1632867 RepID=UPI000698BC86|nr:ATP-binding protein [Methylocucumis oryzae]
MLTQVENDVAGFNFSHITENLHNTIQESPLLDYGILMNAEGVAIINTSHPELQQERLQDASSQYALAQHQLTHKEYPELNVTEFILPINFADKPWGVLRLGFTMQELKREIERSKADIEVTTRDLIFSMAVTALMFVLIGSGLVLVIATTLSRPITRLTDAVRELARGNFQTAVELLDDKPQGKKQGFRAEGEIALLAQSFLEMAEEIQHSHAKLAEYNRTLEEKVKARTLELEQANEKLKELDQMKTNFLSTVSHELRTPLTSVMGFARILQKKFETTLFPPLSQLEDKKIQKAMRQVMDNAQIIVDEGQRLTTLINDVLDLAKMEAGRTDWAMRELAIADIIDRATAATTALFEHKPVVLRKELPESLPLFIGDRDRLIQVVINLISNAVKFTEQGSVTCKAEHIGDELVISIIDTGCGIKPEDQALVFEKFKQVGDTLTDKPKGTGLGLPICKEIIEHHGGRLWLESTLGVGSIFYFSLALPTTCATEFLVTSKDGDEASFVWHSDWASLDAGLIAKLAGRQKPDDGVADILVVDDDPNIRQFLRQELSAENFTIREAGSGEEGLTKIKQAMPDLIILDVKMPHLNGFAVSARLHSDPSTLAIPIILHTIAEDKLLAEQLGIECYLTKPVKEHELLEAVYSVLNKIHRKKILVFDSVEERSQHWLTQLVALGYDVKWASNTEQAILTAIGFVPDLVLAEQKLAEECELVKQLRLAHGLDKTFFTLLS